MLASRLFLQLRNRQILQMVLCHNFHRQKNLENWINCLWFLQRKAILLKFFPLFILREVLNKPHRKLLKMAKALKFIIGFKESHYLFVFSSFLPHYSIQFFSHEYRSRDRLSYFWEAFSRGFYKVPFARFERKVSIFYQDSTAISLVKCSTSSAYRICFGQIPIHFDSYLIFL